jgi:hypothetical protein
MLAAGRSIANASNGRTRAFMRGLGNDGSACQSCHSVVCSEHCPTPNAPSAPVGISQEGAANQWERLHVMNSSTRGPAPRTEGARF